jgi:hypothetical protein
MKKNKVVHSSMGITFFDFVILSGRVEVGTIPPPIYCRFTYKHFLPHFTTISCVVIVRTPLFSLWHYQEDHFFTIYIFQIKKDRLNETRGSPHRGPSGVYLQRKLVLNPHIYCTLPGIISPIIRQFIPHKV